MLGKYLFDGVESVLHESGRATDLFSGDEVVVPRGNIVVLGPDCHQVSALNNASSDHAACVDEGDGFTGYTARLFVKWQEKYRCPLGIFENTRKFNGVRGAKVYPALSMQRMLTQSQCCADICDDVISSSMFGSFQDRERYMAVLADGLRLNKSLLQQCLEHIECQAPVLRSMLMTPEEVKHSTWLDHDVLTAGKRHCGCEGSNTTAKKLIEEAGYPYPIPRLMSEAANDPLFWRLPEGTPVVVSGMSYRERELLWVRLWIHDLLLKANGALLLALDYSFDFDHKHTSKKQSKVSDTLSSSCKRLQTVCCKTKIWLMCSREPLGPIMRPLVMDELWAAQSQDLARQLGEHVASDLPSHGIGHKDALELIGNSFDMRMIAAYVISALVAIEGDLQTFDGVC